MEEDDDEYVGIYDRLTDYSRTEEPAETVQDQDLVSEDEDDDPFWTRGLVDENEEEHEQRKKARLERAKQESCIAGEAAARERALKERMTPAPSFSEATTTKNKKRKKGDGKPVDNKRKEDRIYPTVHSGTEFVTNEGFKLKVLPPTGVKGARASAFGDLLYDTKLKVCTPVGRDVTHEKSRKTEDSDVHFIRRAAQTGSPIPLEDIVVRLGLARCMGSKIRAEQITKNDPRHHTITILPPFEAFSPPCKEPAITKPAGDRTRSFPTCLLSVSTVDMYSVSKLESMCCPDIGGFEKVSGSVPYDKPVGAPTLERPKPKTVKFRSRNVPTDEDGTLKKLFRIRSSYSDITALYWVELSAREVALIHLMLSDLVPLSGIREPSCVGVLPPMSDFFASSGMNQRDGSSPFNLGRDFASVYHCKPLVCLSVPPYANRQEWTDRTDQMVDLLKAAIDKLLASPLPKKTDVFTDDRDPRRPRRHNRLPVRCLERVLNLQPELAKPLSGDWSSLNLPPQDLEELTDYYVDYLRCYLDWRYFVLPDMVIGALAVAYETIHPTLNTGIAIKATQAEHRNATKALRRMTSRLDCWMPTVHILFHHYHYTGYEKYAAALLLWNFVGGKKVLLGRDVQQHKEANQALPKELRQKKKSPTYRTDIVPFDAVYDMYGRTSSGSADMSLVAPTEFVEHVTSHINEVYKWNIFPELFHAKVPDVDHVNVIPIEAFDTKLAIQRREELIAARAAAAAAAAATTVAKAANADTADPATLAALRRAVKRGHVTWTDEHVPEECASDLDKTVLLFNESFTLIKRQERVKLGNGAFRVHWNTNKATRLLRAYMRVHKLFDSEATNYDMMFFAIRDRRAEAPKYDKYFPRPNSRLLFRLNNSSEVGMWFRANLEQDSAKLKALGK